MGDTKELIKREQHREKIRQLLESPPLQKLTEKLRQLSSSLEWDKLADQVRSAVNKAGGLEHVFMPLARALILMRKLSETKATSEDEVAKGIRHEFKNKYAIFQLYRRAYTREDLTEEKKRTLHKKKDNHFFALLFHLVRNFDKLEKAWEGTYALPDVVPLEEVILIPDPNVKFVIHYPLHIRGIYLDLEEMESPHTAEQIHRLIISLHELAQNAHKYTLEKNLTSPNPAFVSIITVTVKLSETELIIGISDNGPGFSQTKTKPGHGTGLSAARDIIETFGGHIDIEERSGEISGTVVTAYLPKGLFLAEFIEA